MMKGPRNLGPHAISAGGGIIMLVELYRHWRYENEMELGVLMLGAFFLWLGGYMANSKRAIEGGGFIVDSFVKIASVVRIGGRRSTDNVVVQQVPAATPAPMAPLIMPLVAAPSIEEPPQITWKDGSDHGDL